MSIEDLQRDLAANSEPAAMAHLPVDVREYFTGTLWPFMENIVTELNEQAAAIDDLIAGESDVLTTETAKELATPIILAQTIVALLEKRVAKGEIKVKAMIADFRVKAETALARLEEITIEEPDDEPEDEDEDPDGDPDSEDDEDEDGDEDAKEDDHAAE